MADVKISALPATAAAALTDLLAKVDAAGPTTQKVTLQQIVNLLQTLSLAWVPNQSFANSKILLNADGSASFQNGNMTINLDGSVEFGVGIGPPSPTTITTAGLITTTGAIEITTASEGYILKSANGTRFKMTVDNAGQLDISPV